MIHTARGRSPSPWTASRFPSLPCCPPSPYLYICAVCPLKLGASVQPPPKGLLRSPLTAVENRAPKAGARAVDYRRTEELFEIRLRQTASLWRAVCARPQPFELIFGTVLKSLSAICRQRVGIADINKSPNLFYQVRAVTFGRGGRI